MSQAMDFRNPAVPFEHWSDDSYNYPDRSSSVAFLESAASGGYTLGSKVRIGAAWFFFAMLAMMWAFVPIFSLLAAPAMLGCVGILTEAYAKAEESRLQPRAPRQLDARAARPVARRV